MAELPDDVGQAARTAYDRLWNDGAQESACLVAALLATYPLIAARVRAEAVAASTVAVSVGTVRDVAAAMVRWCDDPTASPTVLGSILVPLVPTIRAVAVAGHAETVSELIDLVTTLTSESDEFDQRLAAVRAEAVADERQRIETALTAEANRVADVPADATRNEAYWAGRVEGVLSARSLAAGSVPVATPEVHDAGCEVAYGQGSCFCQRRADIDFSHTAPGPVATPTRCEAKHPRYGRCQFLAGHTVDHVTDQGADGDDDSGYSWPVATPTEPSGSAWRPFRNRDDWLRDQHARYHDEPGNMLGRDDCEWQRCGFWDAATSVLGALSVASPVPAAKPQPEAEHG